MPFPLSRVLFSAAVLALSGALLPARDRPAGETAKPGKAAAAAAAAEKPATMPPQIRRAIAAMRAGQWKAARTAWEAVLDAEPDNAAALSNLGKVLCQLEDYPAARTALERATTLKPSLADSWLTLGQTFLALHEPMRALSCMTRGVAENPSDPGAHNSLAIALKSVGWADGAESELQKALDLNPEYAEAHFNLAVMYLERKPPSLEMANRHYQRARELGAEPDTLVEKQLQGETVIDAGASPAASADPTASSLPPAASVSLGIPGAAVPKSADPSPPPSAPKKSSRKS
ncbi:MAG: nrfG [Verrucomicrobiales bacterium]|nr:nrfG [Verrucomicrobiales bacterium]